MPIGRGLFLLICEQGAWRYLGLKVSNEWSRFFYGYDTHREIDRGGSPAAGALGSVVCSKVVLRTHQRVQYF